jgi:hypothetical protein
MRNFSKLLIAAALSTLPSAFAQSAFAQVQGDMKEGDVKEDNVLVCATPADAKSYAASHKDALQSAIAGEADEKAKACVVSKVVFIPGKQSDRIEHSDATYAVTEILIVAVKTPYGVQRMRPNVAYALLRLNEIPV